MSTVKGPLIRRILRVAHVRPRTLSRKSLPARSCPGAISFASAKETNIKFAFPRFDGPIRAS